MDLKKIGYESLDWIQLAQDRNQAWTLLKLAMKIIKLLTIRNFYIQSQNVEYTAKRPYNEIHEIQVYGIYFVMWRTFILSL
jgi:hypothetical protein